jgi:replicative DNA helicase
MTDEQSRTAVEVGYLATCLLTCRDYAQTADRAKDDLFTVAKHKVILEAFRAMPHGESWDISTVTGWLRDNGKLDAAGGVTYLSGLLEWGFGSALSQIEMLESFRAKDEIAELCKTTMRATADTPGVELLDNMESQILRIHSKLNRKTGYVRLADVMPTVLATIEKRMQTGKPVSGIPTGFTDLDALCCGLQDGDLVVVAGYPSRGKSTLAEQITLDAARTGVPTLFFSLEMSQQNVMDRAFSRTTGATLVQVRNGHNLHEYAAKIAEASGEMSELPFWLDATPGLDINAIVSRSRLSALQHGIRLVAVDYLQLVVGLRKRGDSQEAEISETVRQLKNLAREIDAPVVLLSQLRRPPIGARDPEPTMFDLKGSGGIEAHADVVIFVHRPNFGGDRENHTGTCDAEFIVGKQRNGPLGKVSVLYDARHVRFLNRATANITDEGRLETTDDIPR